MEVIKALGISMQTKNDDSKSNLFSDVVSKVMKTEMRENPS